MTDPLRLMCILAHPDDESLGTGGTLAKYAAEGIETYVVTATRGERGWFGDPADNPGLEALGKIREAELRAACEVLGVCSVDFLDYIDGDLDQADHSEVIQRIVGHLRRVRPQVVITFDPLGAYGHPDHIAICQLTTAALVCAADPDYGHPQERKHHRVSKLYYFATTQQLADDYQAIFGDLVMVIDGVERRGLFSPDWGVTTRLDTRAYWRQVLEAVACHRSQLKAYDALLGLPEDFQLRLWGTQDYCRTYSLVNGGRRVETDLFDGLR